MSDRSMVRKSINEVANFPTEFECMECGKKFKKKLGANIFEVKCPKCGSTDVEVG